MSKSLDRLTLLQTFIRIADAGSISAAARDLGLSQPSVSRQLAELESRFQAQLMRRTTHTLSLTEAGKELLADARRLLDDWEALEEKHLNLEATLRGNLKIVAPVALGQRQLADIAFQFQQQHPQLSLTWILQDSDIRFAEVGCDCWIKIGPISDESLVVEPLGQVERMLVAAPKFVEKYGLPKMPAMAQPAKGIAQKLPYVALSPFEGAQIPLHNADKKTVTITPSVHMNTNNIFALHRATLAGLGMSIMPKWFIQQDLKTGQLFDLLPDWRAPSLTVHVASLPGRHRPYRLRSFLELLRTSLPALLDNL